MALLSQGWGATPSLCFSPDLTQYRKHQKFSMDRKKAYHVIRMIPVTLDMGENEEVCFF